MRSLGIGQVLSRNFSLTLPPCGRGKCCPFFSFVFFSVWFLSFAVFLAKFSSSKGRFLRKIFGSELLFLLSFWALMFLIWICLWFSRIFSQFRPGKCLKKILLMSGFLFCLVLSVLGFGLTTSCVLSLFLLFFVQEIKLRSNRTPHPPPHLLLFFLFFSPPLCFVSPVLAVRPFCSGVSSGCHSGPRAVFGFSRDCSDALFGREAVEAFVLFLSVVFPGLRLTRF